MRSGHVATVMPHPGPAMVANALSLVTDGIQLLCCGTEKELQVTRDFRNEVFLNRRGVVFDDGLEGRRDEESHVMLLLKEGVPVATARSQPYPSDLSAVSMIAPTPLRYDADSEVGRIAAKRSPQSTYYSLVLLALGARWLLEHTRHRRYVAYCHPKLLHTYQLVGAEDTGETCVVPGRADRHSIITGNYESCARLGAALLSVSDAPSRAAIRWGRSRSDEPPGQR